MSKEGQKTIDNIEKIFREVTDEKEKLEKLTKKISNKYSPTTKNKTKINNQTPNQTSGKSPDPPALLVKNKIPGVVEDANNEKALENELKKLQMEIESDSSFKHQLKFDAGEFKNISQNTVNKILDLLKNYVNMDTSFRLKHESLKTLYNAYLDLYNKYKHLQGHQQLPPNTSNSKDSNVVIVNKDGAEILKNIHNEMKENNTNLYKHRLAILKQIKEEPEIHQPIKNKLCRRLIAIFKSPPVPEYKPIQLLDKTNIEVNESKSTGIDIYGEEKINVKELDEAYLQKHNELMMVFKAYQNLYNKVLNYKEQLEQYKKLPTGSSISRCEMEKLLKDQRFVMDMIDKMQDNLVDNKIIDDSERVPVAPVVSHPENMGAFNNTIRDQIKHIIDRRVDMDSGVKNKIENLLSKYKKCDSNDEFCNAGRQLLMIKKLD
jgi:hypothetical protein